mmetsp:Transcript_14611/g.26193  ORF Transcript_14611/g.26193 Transcript_14611/m.26193 type:complete len:382 (-) Transcript_14611:214-1359(-)|eukprot:CAMPEP_0184524734 /NCGR_PEP_ID=MMETSP0198_2-20121128/9696_1 /TAXON_ID=1112570 /ORGANISM="Thraustochytrium sp., Strain LLF1b" /LENGTH=381 /DNA_ID=CAMNT_0026916093 /DNA_START=245 /DNA_END=1390 /DNA_ORIENTATION=+
MPLDPNSVVVEAAACGDLEGVKELLASKATTAAQVNGIDKDGRSALHYACLNDDVKLLEMLSADDRTDMGLKTPKGDTCLHLAALYASMQAIKFLFDNQLADNLVNAQNQWKETPLHLCAGSGDKGAAKAAEYLMKTGASLTLVDKWSRTPLDVAHENGENQLVDVISAFLETQSSQVRSEVAELRKAFLEKSRAPVQISDEAKKKHAGLFSGIGAGLKSLKKTEVKEKTMFSKLEGKVTNSKGKDAKSEGKVLSKLIDFPGDVDAIKKFLADESINWGGADAYGLSAMHKFASWNKTELLDLVIPKLTKEEINSRDREGKTALHWAVEMASVGAINTLVACPKVDQNAKDNKGRTPRGILDGVDDSHVIQRIRKALDGGA